MTVELYCRLELTVLLGNEDMFQSAEDLASTVVQDIAHIEYQQVCKNKLINQVG